MREAILRAQQHPLRRRRFVMAEMILVILIVAIIATLGLDEATHFEATQRSDRACRETLTFFRFARTLAQTTGKKTKVAVDTGGRSFAIYWQSNGTSYDATPYSTSLAGGSWTLNLNNARELVGTSVSVSPATATCFEYGPLGTCNQTGTVSFSYAGITRSLVVPSVGDPAVQ